MILDTTSKSIIAAITPNEVFAPVVYSVDYMDFFTTNNASMPGNQLSVSNGNANVTILNSPISSTIIRKATTITAHNEDTIIHALAIGINDIAISSEFTQIDANLSMDDVLTYNDGSGWSALNGIGAIKTITKYFDQVKFQGAINANASISGLVPTTLSNVNPTSGTFGNAVAIPQMEVGANGLVTFLSNVSAYLAPPVMTLGGAITANGIIGTTLSTTITTQTGTGTTFVMQNAPQLNTLTISGLASANQVTVNGNIVVTTGVFWPNGAPLSSDLYSNIGAYETYANGQISSLTTHINTLDANVGLFEINANANITAINSHLISLDANVGLFEINANANITAINSHLITLDANLGAFQPTANAYISSINSHMGNLDANVGGYEIYSNVQLSAINGNITAANVHINKLDANVGAYETWANAQIANWTYSNTNLASYMPVENGNIHTSNVTVLNSNLGPVLVGNITAGYVDTPAVYIFRGNTSWTMPANAEAIISATMFIIGGGGGASGATYSGQGGGGAGGFFGNINILPNLTLGNTYTITVGTGGTGNSGSGVGTSGGNSSAFSTTVRGGGYGAFSGPGGPIFGADGGSGGGGSSLVGYSVAQSGNGINGQGYYGWSPTIPGTGGGGGGVTGPGSGSTGGAPYWFYDATAQDTFYWGQGGNGSGGTLSRTLTFGGGGIGSGTTGLSNGLDGAVVLQITTRSNRSGLAANGNIITSGTITCTNANISGNASIGNITVGTITNASTIFISNLPHYSNGSPLGDATYNDTTVANYVSIYGGNITVDYMKAAANVNTCWTIPVGNTAQRPVLAANGAIRFNTTVGHPEWYSPFPSPGHWFSFNYSLDYHPYNSIYLLVGGGGGGGSSLTNGGGGGGAGGVVTGTTSLTPFATYTITVGGGGAAGVIGASQGASGGNTTVTGYGISLPAAIGGGGGGEDGINSTLGLSGGSGGGNGGVGTTGQGYNGGGGSAPGSGGPGGGGGGGGAIGGSAGGANGGAGGIGANNSTSGTSVTYAGGGGGGSAYTNGLGGLGGLGGGGRAANWNGNITAVGGTVNSGGGGGAGSPGGSGNIAAAGGSGIVILVIPGGRYAGNSNVTGTYTYGTSSGSIVLTFTGSGTYTA